MKIKMIRAMKKWDENSDAFMAAMRDVLMVDLFLIYNVMFKCVTSQYIAVI